MDSMDLNQTPIELVFESLNVSPEKQNDKLAKDETKRNTSTPKKRRDFADRMLPNPNHEYSKRSNRKMRSKKQGRRYENLCYLLSLIDDDNLNFEDDYDDFVNQSSSFTELLLDSQKLEIWIEFISHDGEDQDKILNKIDEIKMRERRLKRHNSDGDKSSDDDLKCAEKCFKKIDKNIRHVMKKQVSLNCLDKYEPEIVSLMDSKLSEYWIDDLECSFERMIFHGLCQYLDVRSKSILRGDGDRQMKLYFNKELSNRPSILLSEFIKIKLL